MLVGWLVGLYPAEFNSSTYCTLGVDVVVIVQPGTCAQLQLSQIRIVRYTRKLHKTQTTVCTETTTKKTAQFFPLDSLSVVLEILLLQIPPSILWFCFSILPRYLLFIYLHVDCPHFPKSNAKKKCTVDTNLSDEWRARARESTQKSNVSSLLQNVNFNEIIIFITLTI